MKTPLKFLSSKALYDKLGLSHDREGLIHYLLSVFSLMIIPRSFMGLLKYLFDPLYLQYHFTRQA